ncbi:MAG: sugar phosphate isomerase/epimerase [Spirochaetales bacterium]|nr:sugar phosphate isomerase/epimerase [Spirochaetales bacterium]
MKYGMNTLLFEARFTNDAVINFPKFKEIGFDGVEIALQEKGDIDTALVKDKLSENGLACGSLCALMGAGTDLRGPGKESIENGKQYIRDLIDTAVEIGAQVIVGPLYSAVGRAEMVEAAQRKTDWQLVKRGLKEVCAYAEDKGIYLALEPLNRFETDFINICADALRMIDEVGSSMLKVHLDTFHMNIEEKSSADAIRAAGDLLYLLHASENDRGAPGTGQVSWESIAEALRDVQYDRWVVIESFTPEVEIIARAASIWRQTEKDGWALAEKGLKYIKDLFGD